MPGPGNYSCKELYSVLFRSVSYSEGRNKLIVADMGDREVYVKRMEAAVLQAGAAISKLKAENTALKKENEEFKAKVKALSRSDKEESRKDQLAAVENRMMSMETNKMYKSLDPLPSDEKCSTSIASMVSKKAVDVATTVSEAGTEERTSSTGIGPLPGAKILTIPAVKMSLATRKSIAMSGLEIGEGLVSITYDAPVMESDEGKVPNVSVNSNVKKISKPLPGIADIFLQAAARIKEQSHESTNATKRISRPLPDVEDLYPQATANSNILSSAIVSLNAKKKISKPLQKVAEAFPQADSLVTKADTSSMMLALSAVDKKSFKKLPEQGWETTFTAGSFSDKKFLGKQFQIKPTMKGVYSVETQKELLPNDTIQLLIANANEKNLHTVAKSLRRFSPDIVAKHLMDHLRHIAYDPELYRDVSNVSDCVANDKNQFEEFVDFNRLEKLPPDFIVRIDRLVLLIGSMYSKNSSDRTKGTYTLLAILFFSCSV